MADALCGPSNALQNFQKHTTVDRTLQQDRFTSRLTPTQGFRSSPGPNAGILDPEFDAFQAGHAHPLRPDAHLQPTPGIAAQFAQAPLAPDWASDFQRLNITSHQPQPIQRQFNPPAVSASASWHQDFMRQQAPVAQAPLQQQPVYASMVGQSSAWAEPRFHQQQGYGLLGSGSLSAAAQRKQRAQDTVPQFDEAAFEQAFEQAHRDALESERTQAQTDYELQLRLLEESDATRHATAHPQPQQTSGPVVEETDPVLLRIREKRPVVYGVMKLRSEIDLGRTAETVPWLESLEAFEHTGETSYDFSEAKWCVENLEKAINRVSPEIKGRVENLITSMNERIMSTYPLSSSRQAPINQEFWQELEAAGYTKTPLPEQMEQQREQKQNESVSQRDDDEMAQTAGKLLERVADNTSEKFQNSQFLELMRRLRDREVRVEGDKMVEVSGDDSINAPIPATGTGAPAVDPLILNHAAQDFGFPIDSEQEVSLSRQSSDEPTTDEISDQFSYYNVHAHYHR